jgi:hypothetical protein
VIVGVISDTHGLLRPEAVAALRGAELILHAGDIGAAAVLDQLRALAPVVAVRGNNDREAWAAALPEVVVESVAGARVCIIHDLKELRADADAERLDVIVSGHSHRPRVERRGRVLLVNPGSAGPRRFRLPIAVAHLYLGGQTPHAEIVELDVGGATPRRQRSAASRSR